MKAHLILRFTRSLLAVIGVHILLSDVSTEGASPGSEPWRPQFHFTPPRNWMNDPNGMLFFEGEYHLFYQYNPMGDRWGHMSWGHAVSRDLTRWQSLPLALAEENGVMIFSGSAVVDWKNTSGFRTGKTPPLVAIYTGHYTEKPLQNQHIAFSNDRGRTWTKFSGNPVLDIGEKDFRDPKVFWHEPTRRWIMTVSWPVPRKVRFYASPNLKDWTHLSDFGPSGSTEGIWECPDLFPLRTENRTTERWVLIVNVGSGAPAGGSGCQYFVGTFDGTRFELDPAAQPKLPAGAATQPALWADFGRDFYAAVSWSDIPKVDGRRLWIGWMSNWVYAQDVPTSPWRSAMSVPRELLLGETPSGLRMIQKPARELARIRRNAHQLEGSSIADANAWITNLGIKGHLLEIAVEFEVRSNAGEFGVSLHSSSREETRLTCNLRNGQLQLDRTRSGRVDFHPAFSGVHSGPLRAVDGKVGLHLLLDTGSIEVFANNGETVLTDLIFPEGADFNLHLLDAGEPDQTRVKSLKIWELAPSAP
ncbi:MAG: glycoside hydrolase family 32 protein [Verrucomicrobia bacterium]|nr:glycoside hydrolase family 32 protein [Verrucomicrobiota bacterium]